MSVLGGITAVSDDTHNAGEILAQILSKKTIDKQIIIIVYTASANISKIDLQEN